MVYNPYQKCLSCGYEWKSHITNPKMCPRCKTRKIEICADRNGELMIKRAVSQIESLYQYLMENHNFHKKFIINDDEYNQSIDDITLAIKSAIDELVNEDFPKIKSNGGSNI